MSPENPERCLEVVCEGCGGSYFTSRTYTNERRCEDCANDLIRSGHGPAQPLSVRDQDPEAVESEGTRAASTEPEPGAGGEESAVGSESPRHRSRPDQLPVSPENPERKQDRYGRAIFGDREVPDAWQPSSRFAQWRGKTCGPWTVISGLRDDRHRIHCRDGWIMSGEWWFVCGRCHPDAIDQPGTSDHQRREASRVP